jgi:hypothetical protein
METVMTVVKWWVVFTILITLAVAIKTPTWLDPSKGIGKFIWVNALVLIAVAYFIEFIEWLFG